MDEKMKKAFDLLLDNLMKDEEDHEQQKIADVDRDLVHLHHKYIRKKRSLIEDIEMEKERLEIEVNQRLKRYIENREDEIVDIKREFWNSVYERYDLDPNQRYQMKEKELFLLTENKDQS